MKYTNIALAAAALTMGLAVAGPAFARNNTAVPASAHYSLAAAQKPKQQTFSGTIAKSGSGYVLESGGHSYKLSDASQAAKFVGKQVTVTGTLDASTGTIQVSNIQQAM